MGRMCEDSLNSSEFYKMPKWLFRIKGLQPSDLLLYAVAYNHWKLSLKNKKFDEDGAVYFYLTHEKIREKLEMGKNQVISSIKRLVACGVLIGIKEAGKATKYYLEDNIESINFDITSLKKSTTQKQSTPVVEIKLHQSEISEYNQSEKGEINKSELSKTNVSKSEEIRKRVALERITQELKEKLLEYIEYRKAIRKPIRTYKSIGILLKQLGKRFKDEQHLIDSIEETFMHEYQGVFPTKYRGGAEESSALKRLRTLRGHNERRDFS